MDIHWDYQLYIHNSIELLSAIHSNGRVYMFERINYFADLHYKQENKVSNTMQWLMFFNANERNEDNYIRQAGDESWTNLFPTNEVRLFMLMGNQEETHTCAEVWIPSARQHTYEWWFNYIIQDLDGESTTEAELIKFIRNNLTLRSQLNWEIREYVGWSADKTLRNPATSADAYRFVRSRVY